MTPAQMAELHRTSFVRGWSVVEIMALLAKPTTLVASTDAGFALVQVFAPEAEVLTIVIDPARRGQGIGETLLQQAVLAAQFKGVERLFLEVDSQNVAARALYDKAGFIQTGLRRNYYTHDDGTRSDAVMMSLILPPNL